MPFAETCLKRVDQSLSDIRTRDQAIDQHINIFEVVASIVIRRGEIDLLSVMKQAREATLHQAHQMSGDYVTGRHGDAATGGITISPFLLVSLSPRPSVRAVFSCPHCRLGFGYTQTGIRRKQNIK